MNPDIRRNQRIIVMDEGMDQGLSSLKKILKYLNIFLIMKNEKRCNIFALKYYFAKIFSSLACGRADASGMADRRMDG